MATIRFLPKITRTLSRSTRSGTIFVRVYKTLRTSPAMATGIEQRLWSMEDVVALIDEEAERNAPRLADRLVG